MGFADDVIRELYPVGGANKCLALLPGWTAQQVRDRAKRMRVRAPKGLGGKKLREEVDRIIRKHYPTGGALACQPHLPDMTINAIHKRAARLEIRVRVPVLARTSREPEGWGDMEHATAEFHRLWQRVDVQMGAANDGPLVGRIAA